MVKVKAVAIIMGAVLMGYLILLASMPTIIVIFQGVGARLAARVGIENYFGVQEAVAYLPWMFWFLPAVFGIIAIVIVLKHEDTP